MGLFISMEGSDGSGKTMQMNMLEQELRQRGLDVLRSREPGGTAISEKIRDMLLDPANTEMSDRTEALLYAASRAQHVEQVLKPALRQGKIVLCDRYVDSSLVYQGIGRGLGIPAIEEINAFATGGLQPDVTIVLQIDFEEGLRRKGIQNGGLDRMEAQKEDFLRRIHDGFTELKELYPERVFLIDGAKAPSEVFQKIQNVLKPFLTGL